MRRTVLGLGTVALIVAGLGACGCGGPTELSNADVAAKKAELNAGATPDQKQADAAQGDRGH